MIGLLLLALSCAVLFLLPLAPAALEWLHPSDAAPLNVVREYGALPLVECLPSQLNQVFMNLFVNAAQSIPDGRRGTLSVRTGHAGEQVWIEVEDDGCGIPPEVLDRIFDPFFTTKPVGKGTGLGLALSYGIIQKHHGTITASSPPGSGTTFRITLPVHQPVESGNPA